MDCHENRRFSRNDTKLVGLPTNPNIYPRNDTKPVVTPRPLWESGFADGAGKTANTAIPPDSERIEPAGALLRWRNSVSVEQSQDRRQLFLSRQAKATDAGEGLNIILTITHPILPSYREGTRVVAQLTHYQRPIIALTSQVGEVAVVRTPVSYKCGWGSVKANPHRNQLEPSGKIYGCGCGAENQSPLRPPVTVLDLLHARKISLSEQSSCLFALLAIRTTSLTFVSSVRKSASPARGGADAAALN